MVVGDHVGEVGIGLDPLVAVDDRNSAVDHWPGSVQPPPQYGELFPDANSLPNLDRHRLEGWEPSDSFHASGWIRGSEASRAIQGCPHDFVVNEVTRGGE